MTKFFLDTCSFIALSGLDENGFCLLTNSLIDGKSELFSSHIQAEEKYSKNNSDVRQVFKKAFEKFEKHGIKVNLQNTKGLVIGVSKFGYASFSNDYIKKIYGALKDELKKCMSEKGKYDSKPFDKDAMLNNSKDCLIAVTSVDYDYFITSDDCLYKSWEMVLQRSENREVLSRIPVAIYVEPNPEKVLKLLSDILDIHKQM